MSEKKTIPTWVYVIGLILFGIGAYFFVAKSAGPYYIVNISYSGSTEQASINFNMPLADAQYFNQRFGTDELQADFQRYVTKRIKDRIAGEKANDARRAWNFVTQAEKDSALAREQYYRDTLGTWQQ